MCRMPAMAETMRWANQVASGALSDGICIYLGCLTRLPAFCNRGAPPVILTSRYHPP